MVLSQYGKLRCRRGRARLQLLRTSPNARGDRRAGWREVGRASGPSGCSVCAFVFLSAEGSRSRVRRIMAARLDPQVGHAVGLQGGCTNWPPRDVRSSLLPARAQYLEPLVKTQLRGLCPPANCGGDVSANFCGLRVPRGQRDGSPEAVISLF
jgi:hypothetical protein